MGRFDRFRKLERSRAGEGGAQPPGASGRMQAVEPPRPEVRDAAAAGALSATERFRAEDPPLALADPPPEIQEAIRRKEEAAAEKRRQALARAEAELERARTTEAGRRRADNPDLGGEWDLRDLVFGWTRLIRHRGLRIAAIAATAAVPVALVALLASRSLRSGWWIVADLVVMALLIGVGRYSRR